MNFFEKIEDSILKHQERRDGRRAEEAMRRGDIGAAMKYENRAKRADMKRNGLEDRAEVRAEGRAEQALLRGEAGRFQRAADDVEKIRVRRAVENFSADINNPAGGAIRRNPMQGNPTMPLAPEVQAPPSYNRINAFEREQALERDLANNALQRELALERDIARNNAFERELAAERDLALLEGRQNQGRTNALLNDEVASERLAQFDAATGNYVAAAMDDARAQRLDNMRNAEQRLERDLAEQRAVNDLAQDDEGGFLSEKMRALRIENQREEDNFYADANRPGGGMYGFGDNGFA